MSKDKQMNKLGAEELSRRVAPLGTVYNTEVPDDPTTVPSGGDTGGANTLANQPGNSDGHRDKLFKKVEP